MDSTTVPVRGLSVLEEQPAQQASRLAVAAGGLGTAAFGSRGNLGWFFGLFVFFCHFLSPPSLAALEPSMASEQIFVSEGIS